MPEIDFVELFARKRPEIQRSGTGEMVAAVLRQRIGEGDLPPGTQLAEEALAESLHVSRNSLREAFRLLAHERLISHELHRGVFVRKLSRVDVLEVYSARIFIEVAAVANCPADHRQLESALHAVGQAEEAALRQDWSRVATENLAFHQALVDSVGSKRISETSRQLLAEVRLAFYSMADSKAFLAPYIPRNRLIAQTLLSGRSAEAAELMRDYLNDSREQLSEALGLE
ncbi:GntR family transcriptional regulator [Psychromicrobium sp. YIM B11713]|uniref:GntR family transcriptional regulator n=1 Tax=Psychromicrobium sp. YIM B11713 TaxID=3145233 RepID=UPI00374E62A2